MIKYKQYIPHTHHSYVKCNDCGERHSPGNKEDCIEFLKSEVEDLRDTIEKLNKKIQCLEDLVEKYESD